MAAATSWSGRGPIAGVLATAAAASAVGILVYRCVRRLGGVTGDVMGAGIEIAFTVMIMMMII
jgi:adenosylcobinamide-GDP ribazoletransferase